MKHLACLALSAAVLIAAPASAATLVVNGTTVGGPVFGRTLAGTPPTDLSAVGTAVNYSVFGVIVGSTGSYSLTVDSSFDSFLSLYANAFNPADALANIVAANDDLGADVDAQIIATLTSGVSYFAVVSAFENGVAGAFRLTIDGPGTILPAAVIPEPASWALMLAGFGLIGASLRYGRRTTAVTFG